MYKLKFDFNNNLSYLILELLKIIKNVYPKMPKLLANIIYLKDLNEFFRCYCSIIA